MEGGVSGTLDIIESMCGSERVSLYRELEVLVFVDDLLYSSDTAIIGQLNLVWSRIIPSVKVSW